MQRPSPEDLLRYYTGGHDNIQMDSFITAKEGGTLYGMFLQALAEMNTRRETLKLDAIARERLVRQKRRLESSRDQDADLDTREIELKLDSVNRRIENLLREFNRFYQQAVTLESSLDLTNIPKLEEELWVHRLKIKAVSEVLAGGKVSPGTVQAISTLEPRLREEVIQHLMDETSVRSLVDWFKSQSVLIPPLIPLEELTLARISSSS